MLPVIAIVGRPNVGKSTFFNCVTRTRDALVSDFPGLTRDRQYGHGKFGDHAFIAIDTAGIMPASDGVDELSIQQSMQAVQEADHVLFLVDAREGLKPADQDIAEKLRAFNKKTTLVINKSEDRDEDVVLSEFYKLGFKSLFAISAAHQRGIHELLHPIFENIPSEPETLETPDAIKLAIIGRPNVGKSTLTNRMLGETRVIVFDEPGTTRDSIFIPMERRDKNYILIDTAGVRRKGKVFETIEKFSVVKTLQAIEDTHVVLFVMDANEGVTEQDLRLLGFILDSGKALVIAINKWDGLSEEQREHAKASLDRKLNFLNFARIHYISALHGSGVGNLFHSVDEAYASAQKKLSTSRLNKILGEAVLQHNPPLVHGRRVKLRYAHSGGHFPPRIIIHGNQVESLPESYRRFLINVFQTKLKLVGTPVFVEFKNSENPFKDRRNVLTEAQLRKRRRMIRHQKG